MVLYPIRVIDSKCGAVLAIRVIPRACRDSVSGIRGDALVVRVTVPPVEGAANSAVIDAIAGFLGVPRRRLTITAGTRGRDKKILIEGLTAAEVRSKVATVASPPSERPRTRVNR